MLASNRLKEWKDKLTQYILPITASKNIKDDPVRDALRLNSLKLQKHNIGTKEKPKLASIGDYQYEQTTKEIFDLLKEYEDLFPASI